MITGGFDSSQMTIGNRHQTPTRTRQMFSINSALISWAALFKRGKTLETIALGLERDTLAMTFIAAVIRPDRSTIGTARAQSPSSISWFINDHPRS